MILFSDPSGEAPAKAVSAELARIGGASVQVVVGADALKALEAKGVKESDLLSSPVIANHLTADDADLVVIRLDHRSAGGDEVLESRIWAGGRSDSHVAIAGKGGDPTSGALNGIIDTIGPRLPSAPGAADTAEDGQLSQLSERREWKTLLAGLADKPGKNPRQFYYLVEAQVHLGQLDDARKTLDAMAMAHPGHFLIKAATSLLPPPADSKPADPGKALPEGNELRDAPPVKDDGGNVLK